MNSLLKRQIRKFLSDDLKDSKDLDAFLKAVNLSYNNFDEQSAMIQRAMAISSDELYEANRKLQQEAQEQKELIDKLKNVINKLKFFDHNTTEENDTELNGLELVSFIEGQAKEIVDINNQREKLMQELEHQNTELSDYAHMVSHDLKSPLRSIDTLAAWLVEDNKDKLDDHCNSQLGLIRANVAKMDSLINGILQYSTIAKSEVELYEVDLNKLLSEITSEIHSVKSIEFVVGNLPKIYGDRSRLMQLFQNLIDNAIKYNNKNKAIIEIGALDKGDFWEFFVKDNGIGIDKKFHKKIFNTFIKLENNVDSTGIGLAIVKKIIEVYGGAIWLDSTLGKGTTFRFTLKKQDNGAA